MTSLHVIRREVERRIIVKIAIGIDHGAGNLVPPPRLAPQAAPSYPSGLQEFRPRRGTWEGTQ
jgi:hypothetical protein